MFSASEVIFPCLSAAAFISRSAKFGRRNMFLPFLILRLWDVEVGANRLPTSKCMGRNAIKSETIYGDSVGFSRQ